MRLLGAGPEVGDLEPLVEVGSEVVHDPDGKHDVPKNASEVRVYLELLASEVTFRTARWLAKCCEDQSATTTYLIDFELTATHDYDCLGLLWMSESASDEVKL